MDEQHSYDFDIKEGGGLLDHKPDSSNTSTGKREITNGGINGKSAI
jgi:hypothetical protein